MDHIGQVMAKLNGMGATLIAFSLLSQGNATAECAVVCYHKPSDPFNPFIVHTARFEQARAVSFQGGHYHDNVIDALDTFRDKLDLDAQYVNQGTPLTGQPQGN